MNAVRLLEIGIPAKRIKVCWYCPAAYAFPQQKPEMVQHQKERHGYISDKPRIWHGGLRSQVMGR